jgi:hypothetical protein
MMSGRRPPARHHGGEQLAHRSVADDRDIDHLGFVLGHRWDASAGQGIDVAGVGARHE